MTGDFTMAGKQVRLFLVDGTFGGPMTAEIMNWTGHILRGKRSQLAEIRTRPEAQRPGVYILLGEHAETGGPVAYIGIGDDVAKRLGTSTHRVHTSQHEWTDVAIITSKDANLTSAHVRYLESRLIQLAKSVERVPLDNTNEPSGGSDLPEADASDMDYFISQLQILMPVVGFDLFRGRGKSRVASADSPSQPAAATEPMAVPSSPVFFLTNRRARTRARAQVIDGEFTVLAGSEVNPSMPDVYKYAGSTARQYERRQRMHSALLTDGAISIGRDGGALLARDVVFASPSAAASLVQGRASANGREAWKTADGVSYGTWEDRGIG